MQSFYAKLVQGPILPSVLADLIASPDPQAGAGNFFLGVVRADQLKDKIVDKIDYQAYQALAEKQLDLVIAQLVEAFPLKKTVILHAVGDVRVGEIALLVYLETKHRKDVFQAVQRAVNLVKTTVPIWKKEIFTDQTHTWVHCPSCYHWQEEKTI